MSPKVNSISFSFEALILGSLALGAALTLTELKLPRLERTVKDAIEAEKVFLKLCDFIIKPTLLKKLIYVLNILKNINLSRVLCMLA